MVYNKESSCRHHTAHCKPTNLTPPRPEMSTTPASTGSNSALELIVGRRGQLSTFTIKDDYLLNLTEKWPVIQTPIRNVVWAEISEDLLEVSLLAKRKRNLKKGSLALVRITGKVTDDQREPAAKFTEVLMSAAYQGVQPRRRLLVLVNPHSGPGKAVHYLKKKVEPLFRAARCVTDITYTTHAKHATEIVKDLPLDKYDAIITMSGDGLIHEVLNGLAAHTNPLTALSTPIAPIPTGSGNGLALNLLGIEEGGDIFAAALNAAKGKPMPIDLFSVTQQGTRVFSFMSQCVGLMAELDLWTENLRFLGSTRFIYGFVKGVARHRACPVKLQIKVASSDKNSMVTSLHQGRSDATSSLHSIPPPNSKSKQQTESGTGESLSTGGGKTTGEQGSTVSSITETIPELKYPSDNPEGDGWITFDKPLLYIYAGKGPYVSKDFMCFPVSLPGDGFIDVVVQEQMSRGELLKALDGAEDGQPYWLDSQHYFKAEAYRVEPHSDQSCFAVDGEEYPFEPFQVEVHKGLASLLSPYGYYNVEFKPKS